MAVSTGLVFLAAALWYGGWYWAVVGAAAFAVLWLVDFSPLSVLLTVGTSIFWLALFHWTGDRRLFFPYSMQFAVQAACLVRGRVSMPAVIGGGGIVLVFTVIRIIQSATLHVLTVELIVAAAVLAICSYLYGLGSPDKAMQLRTVTATLGSVMAFAGLVF